MIRRSRSAAASIGTSTSAKDVSASSRSAASSTTGGSAVCRCCSKRPKRKAARRRGSKWIGSMKKIWRRFAAWLGLDRLEGQGRLLSCQSCPLRLAKHLGLEPPQLRAIFPGVAWKTRFVTRLREKRFDIPLPFNRNLRKQQTAAPSALDDQAVPADLDSIGAGDRLERSEQRHLDLDPRYFRFGDRRKTRVAAAGRDGAAWDDVAKRFVDLDMTDASAQIAARVERDECSAEPRKNPGAARRRKARARDMRSDRLPRQAQ